MWNGRLKAIKVPTCRSQKLCTENPGKSGWIARRIRGLEEWEVESTEKIEVLSDLDLSILNQVEDEEIKKEIEESSKLKAEIQEWIVNIDLATTAISSNSGSEDKKESVSSAGSVNSLKKSDKSGNVQKR